MLGLFQAQRGDKGSVRLLAKEGLNAWSCEVCCFEKAFFVGGLLDEAELPLGIPDGLI